MKTDNEKQDLFVEFLFMDEDEGGAGGDPRKAKILAGYDPNYSTRVLLSGKRMQDLIEKATKDYFTQVAPESVMSMVAVLRNPSMIGATNRLSAAKELLDRAGFVKTEKVQVDASGGLFILPSKDKEEES